MPAGDNARSDAGSSPRNLPADLPPAVTAFLEEMGYFQPDTLSVGAVVPPLMLESLTRGGMVPVCDPTDARPVALIFGSYT